MASFMRIVGLLAFILGGLALVTNPTVIAAVACIGGVIIIGVATIVDKLDKANAGKADEKKPQG